MTWAAKLKVSNPNCEEIYETRKNKVRSIEINTEEGIIEIVQDRSDWDHIVIPINKIRSFKYKSDESNSLYHFHPQK